MKANGRFATFLLTLAIALPTLAYEHPLSSEAIREAHFAEKDRPAPQPISSQNTLTRSPN